MIKVKQVKLNKKMLNEIIEIDKTFYKDFDYENNKSWYYERYVGKEFAILYVENKIVGYYCIYPISKKLFEEVQKGNYSGDYDFPLSEIYVENSRYNYVSSVLVLTEYRRYSIYLLEKLRKDVLNLQNLVAMAISKSGNELCKLFMEKCCDVENYTVYVKTADHEN